jgi:hypothetical protein
VANVIQLPIEQNKLKPLNEFGDIFIQMSNLLKVSFMFKNTCQMELTSMFRLPKKRGILVVYVHTNCHFTVH